jgi:L-alanine-DL-glutamate epimerase-like enolase superfamily enzyme
MPLIQRIRPVLLSAPYAFPENNENRIHLPTNYRSCGLVEVTLSNGSTGLGEGYLAVFAPGVFVSIVELIAKHLVGREAFDVSARYRDMCSICDYWSMQGAARHAIAAIEIALVDAKAKSLGIPAYLLLGGAVRDEIEMYGSGGDSPEPSFMTKEIDLLREREIRIFKIRSRNHEDAKAAWVMEKAQAAGIQVAIDMTQNLSNPAQSVSDVVRFLERVKARINAPIRFLEEPLGPMDRENWRTLRRAISTPVCGGETVTMAAELCERMRFGCYEFPQPDATVIGGMGQVMEVFALGRQLGMDTVVHCWGSGVGMMANYHCAFAGGGQLVEWPMPQFPLRERLLVEPLRIQNGRLQKPTAHGIGVRLTPEIEKEFPFREDAVYRCLASPVAYNPQTWQ